MTLTDGERTDPGVLAWLVCPECKGELDRQPDRLRCGACRKEYPVRDGVPHFLEVEDAARGPGDLRRWVKGALRNHPRLTEAVNTIFNHPLRRRSRPRKILRGLGADCRAVNLGSGNSDWGPRVVNLDAFPGPRVRIVADVQKLPFPDGHLDWVFSIVVLEHVPDLDAAMREMERVLRPGGGIYALVPFIQGYHAAPADFRRWTVSGVRRLFERFDVERIETGDGPTSSLVWVLREWTATLLSFNLRPLYSFWYALVTLLTFPLKQLDHLLSRYRTAERIACNFAVVARKPAVPGSRRDPRA